MKQALTDSSNRMLLEDESDDDDYRDFLLNSKASDLKATFAIAAAFAAATTMSKHQMKHWSSLKVAELKEELKKRGIKAVGKKADLVLLLKKHHPVTSTGIRYSSSNSNEQIMHVSRAELTKLLKKINKDYPKVGRGIFEDHHPDKEPIIPVRNDPLLQRCFHCPSTDADDLHEWYGLLACSRCYPDTFNRTEVCEWLHMLLSSAEKHKNNYFFFSSGEMDYHIFCRT